MRAVSLLFHDVYLASPSESGFRSAAADRYKLSLREFLAQLDGVAQARADAPVLAGPGNPPAWGAFRPSERTQGAAPPFLITADDGGVSYYTIVADALESRGWRGHCFVSTDFIGTSGFLDAARIRELDRRGHVVGTHSASHPARFSACSFERMVREWSHSRQVLEEILGHHVDVASVPGGYFSTAVARAARIAGIRVLFTSEPVTTVVGGPDCLLVGRFTVRGGERSDAAQRLVAPRSWARSSAWISWNAKGLVKPLLGPSYMRISDWLHTARPSKRPTAGGAFGGTS